MEQHPQAEFHPELNQFIKEDPIGSDYEVSIRRTMPKYRRTLRIWNDAESVDSMIQDYTVNAQGIRTRVKMFEELDLTDINDYFATVYNRRNADTINWVCSIIKNKRSKSAQL